MGLLVCGECGEPDCVLCRRCSCCDDCCDCPDDEFDADELGLDPEEPYDYPKE